MGSGQDLVDRARGIAIVDLGFLSPRMFYGTFLLFQTLLFPKRVLKKNSVIVFVTRYYACRFLDICIYVYFKNVV